MLYYRDLLNQNYRKPSEFWHTIKQIFPSKPHHSTGQGFKIDNTVTTNKKPVLNGFGSFLSTPVYELKKISFPLIDFVWKLISENGIIYLTLLVFRKLKRV